MSSSPAATMAASRMMRYSKASLQHLIRSHLRPAAAIELNNNAPGSLRPLSEPRPFMRSCTAQDFVASEIRSLDQCRSTGEPPIQFRFGLARIEVRGGPIKIDDEVNNSDDDEEEGNFDEGDEDTLVDDDSGDSDADFYDDDDDDGK